MLIGKRSENQPTLLIPIFFAPGRHKASHRIEIVGSIQNKLSITEPLKSSGPEHIGQPPPNHILRKCELSGTE
jgi:hypothetical protein